MGQANNRGTWDERRELATAWDEAHKEDRERFPPPESPHPNLTGSWGAIAALALALNMRRF